MRLEHWPEYCIEAVGLGTFMVSAGVFATLLYAPTSPIPEVLPNSLLRDAMMGIAMGLTAIGIIYSPWGKRSGAHINPAVTLTFFRLGKIDGQDALGYAVFQFIGGLLGVLLVAALVGEPFTNLPVNHVVTVPGQWGVAIALLAEFILSFGLMIMVLITSNIPSLSKFTGLFSGIMVAIYITFEAPISGMSINPARTFASALPAQVWDAFWIYYFAPPLAMLSAAEIYRRWSKLSTRSICCKLCPNGETPCISTNCCGHCEDLVRPWNQPDRIRHR
ncbi:MAG: aquaporin family protein [Cyanothece sp. SIO1E1]|nr:aquaporin family protein [Cyanothece sp. SIO1E1]